MRTCLALGPPFLFLLLCSGITNAQVRFDVPIDSLRRGSISLDLDGNRLEESVSHESVRTMFPNSRAPIYIHYMPWWGKPDHLNIGLNEHDSSTLVRQVNEMIARGFDGVVVTESHSGPFNTETTHRIFAEVQKHPGFGFAIMYNQGGLSTTENLIQSLRGDQDDYFRSPQYLRHDGKPVVFFFDRPDAIDFAAARSGVSGVDFIFRNPGGFKASGSGGAFAWMNDSGETAEAYFSRFDRAASDNSSAYSVASVMKGFNDRLASWGKNRVVDERCGGTFLENIRRVPRHVDLIQLNTWNDYEEGTDLEQGIDNCGRVQIALKDRELRISPSFGNGGTLDTVERFDVYATIDGKNAAKLGSVTPRETRFQLPAQLPARAQLFVQMVGKPLFRNHLSNFVALPQ